MTTSTSVESDMNISVRDIVLIYHQVHRTIIMKGKVRQLVERMNGLIKVVYIAASPCIKEKHDPRECTCIVLIYNCHQRNV